MWLCADKSGSQTETEISLGLTRVTTTFIQSKEKGWSWVNGTASTTKCQFHSSSKLLFWGYAGITAVNWSDRNHPAHLEGPRQWEWGWRERGCF